MQTFIVINGRKINALDIAEKFGMEDITHNVELLQETPSGTVRVVAEDNVFGKQYGAEIYFQLPGETEPFPVADAIVSEQYEGSPLRTSLRSRKSEIAETFLDMRPTTQVNSDPKDPRITILQHRDRAVQVFVNSDKIEFHDDCDREVPKFTPLGTP